MRRLVPVLLLTASVLAGCRSSPGDPPVFTGTARDLPAPTAEVARYAFAADLDGTGDDALPTATGTLRRLDDPNSIEWDLGLRGREIVLNGGTQGPGAGVGVVVDVPFEEVTDALIEDVFYRRDGESPCPTGPPRAVCTGDGDGWYETLALPGGGEAVVPRPGTTLLLRLGDGAGYAKVAVRSYYRGAPEVGAIGPGSEPGFYTLDFAVDPDGATFVEIEE